MSGKEIERIAESIATRHCAMYRGLVIVFFQGAYMVPMIVGGKKGAIGPRPDLASLLDLVDEVYPFNEYRPAPEWRIRPK